MLKDKLRYVGCKRLILVLLSLSIATSILGTSVMRVTAKTRSSAGKISQLVVQSPESTPTPTPTPSKVNYYLPYPGMLPDHPLYWLKMMRDKVWLMFTTDSNKKIETLLLFSDKRLGAGRVLIEGGKAELGLSTVTKAEKYLEQSVGQAKEAKQKGKDVSDWSQRISQASLKHQETLQEILPKVPDQGKEVILKAIDYSRQVYEESTGLLK